MDLVPLVTVIVWEYHLSVFQIQDRPELDTLVSRLISVAPQAPAPSDTVNVWPAIVTVLERGPLVLAAAVMNIFAAPLPELGETCSHPALLLADQEHPDDVFRATETVPPVSSNEAIAGVIV